LWEAQPRVLKLDKFYIFLTGNPLKIRTSRRHLKRTPHMRNLSCMTSPFFFEAPSTKP